MRKKIGRKWRHRRAEMPPWITVLIYIFATLVVGFTLPHVEYRYLQGYNLGLDPSSALTIYGAVASGMLALTGIVFSLSMVMVQFGSSAYSPRLVQWAARDPVVIHATGVFAATFLYALVAAAWVNRGGTHHVPPLSTMLVYGLLIGSVLFFTRLVQRTSDLQITNVLALIGDQGRRVIAETYLPLGEDQRVNGGPVTGPSADPVTQVLTHSGPPRVIGALDITSLVASAKEVDAAIVFQLGVGSTIMEGEPLLNVHGGKKRIPEGRLLKAVHLSRERTFEQDPKYALRLLVDVAIKALSPGINDPTTAVQALDQVEDHLRRIGGCRLDAGHVKDESGVLRLSFPTPAWSDFLHLATDEIRSCGANSVQVMRRLRKALKSLLANVPPSRQPLVEDMLSRLDSTVERAYVDPADRSEALQEDRQGLGQSDSPENEQ